MRRPTHAIAGVLAVFAAAGLTASAAGAQNLEQDAMAAALALPVLTGGQTGITLNTVTNGKTSAVLLKVDVISGDPPAAAGGDTWQSDSFDCLLTGRETATFLFVPAGTGSTLHVECSTPFATDGFFADNKIVSTRAANGILWVAAADPATGRTISESVLFGDSVVIDSVIGQSFSFGAIPFQAGDGVNDGNKVYEFDGQEYARWPSALAGQGTAILFTLDGTTGNPTPPRAVVGGIAYDEDGNGTNFQHSFECFDIVNLPGAFVQLVPQPVGTASNDVHDAVYGDANNIRRRAVHGWSGDGRPLAQGRGALMPFADDQDPVLDADPIL